MSSPLPLPVRAMLEAASDTGDKAKVQAVVEIAQQTNTAANSAITTWYNAFLDRQTELATKMAADKEAATWSAGLLNRWNGKAELGASRATGAKDDLGLATAVKRGAGQLQSAAAGTNGEFNSQERSASHTRLMPLFARASARHPDRRGCACQAAGTIARPQC